MAQYEKLNQLRIDLNIADVNSIYSIFFFHPLGSLQGNRRKQGALAGSREELM